MSRKRSFSAGNLSQNLHGTLDIILVLSLNGTLELDIILVLSLNGTLVMACLTV